jgi:hypothetical protein
MLKDNITFSEKIDKWPITYKHFMAVAYNHGKITFIIKRIHASEQCAGSHAHLILLWV